jgi:endonuclease/exonuclease/phosphatase family metal-dependent hydrolase
LKRGGIFRTGLKYLSMAAAVSLFACFISTLISPAKIWFLAYFGLLFQYLFLANLIFMLLWVAARNKLLIIIHAVVLVTGLFFAGYFIRFFGSDAVDTANKGDIKIMTYNVQGFRIPYVKNTTQTDIAEFIRRHDPDIVCMQEFYVNNAVTEATLNALFGQYPYHDVFYSVRKANRSYGVATFSKYPIKMTLEIPFENTANAAMYTDVNVDGQIIRVYNVHFQSIKLGKLLSGAKRIDEIEEMSSRLKTAFVKRAGQVDIVAKHIDVSPYPVIICGDFNDTPISYTYRKIKGDRVDAFCEAGKGIPSTYRLSIMPSFRIDYILCAKSMRAKSYKVHKVDYSDHYPVSSVVTVK